MWTPQVRCSSVWTPRNLWSSVIRLALAVTLRKPTGRPWTRVACVMLFCYAAEESVPPPSEISSAFQKANLFYFNLWRPVFIRRACFCRLSKHICKWKWLLVPCAMPIIGYLKGGDTIRLLHSHSDACLTIPSAEQGEELQKSVIQTPDILHITVQGTSMLHIWFCKDLVIFFLLILFSRVIHYETGSASSHARSLWRLEILRVVYVDTVWLVTKLKLKLILYLGDAPSVCW